KGPRIRPRRSRRISLARVGAPNKAPLFRFHRDPTTERFPRLDAEMSTMANMKGADILRVVDALHREKAIDKELIFQGIESALLSAAKKKLGANQNIVIEINRDTGDITALDG